MILLIPDHYDDWIMMPKNFFIENDLAFNSNGHEAYVVSRGNDDADDDLCDKIVKYVNEHPEEDYNFGIFELPSDASDYIIIRDGEEGDYSTVAYVVDGELNYWNHWTYEDED